MSTSTDLVKFCLRDDFPDTFCVMVDYFNNNHNQHLLIYAIYQDMIKNRGVDSDLLHKCFIANRLDELISKKI